MPDPTQVAQALTDAAIPYIAAGVPLIAGAVALTATRFA